MKKKSIFLALLLYSFSIFSESQKIPILYWSDFGGKYIDFSNDKINYIEKLKTIEYLQNIYPIEHQSEKSLFFHNGSFFFPDSSARYILNQEGGVDIILSLLKKSGADIYSFHRKDFYTPYSLLQKISNSIESYQLKFLISNLNCSNLENPICKMKDNLEYKVVNSGGIKIAVFSFVDVDVLNKVSIKTAEGISLISPETIIEKNLSKLKEENIESIFVISSIDWKNNQERADFLKKFPQISLMIDSESDMKIEESFRHKTIVVGKNRDIDDPLLIIGEKRDSDSKIDFYTISYQKKGSYSPFDNIFNEKLEKFREKYFSSDLGVHLSKEMSFKKSLNFILDFLKTEVKTEVIVVNKEMFINENSKLFPIKAVDSSFMQKMIRFNEPLYTIEITGKELESWIKKYKSNENLIFYGVSGKDSLLIDDFPFVKERVYRVTMSRFLFFGGDGYFTDLKQRKNSSKKFNIEISKEIYELWLDNYPKINKKNQLTPNEFNKSISKFHFEFRNKANLSFSKGGVKNDSSYEDPIFTKLSTSEVNIELSSFLGAISKNHIVDQEFITNYALLKEEDNSYKEKTDMISYRINYKNRYFKKENSPFILPLPYSEAKIETEIDKPEDRDYHNLNGIFSIGASFLNQSQRFEMKFGGTISKQILAENEETQYGISVGYNLKPIEFLKITWESSLNYFLSFSDKKQEKGDWFGKIYIPIFKNFYTFAKGSFNIYREESDDYAYIYDFTFGLTLMWSSWF
ncbi:hypothetical protein JXR93_12590 [bacterium]|nr:hypothetical protein [bacterium]